MESCRLGSVPSIYTVSSVVTMCPVLLLVVTTVPAISALTPTLHISPGSAVSCSDLGSPDTVTSPTNISSVSIAQCPPPVLGSYSEMLSALGLDTASISSLTISNQSGNQTEMSVASLVNLPNLELLELVSCDVKTLPVNFLDNFPHLLSLNLRDNQISQLPSQVFRSSTLLELVLSGNGLRTLPADVFAATPQLRLLDLSHNDLAALPGAIFSGLEHLEILDISHNRVQTLSEAILADNTFLRILDCRHNQLAAIDEMVFRKNNLLEEINLSHNKVGKTFSSKYLLQTSQIFFPS